MSAITASEPAVSRNWAAEAEKLAAAFGERASHHDQSGTFVKANYDDLRNGGFFGAGIPAELGGGGASYAELCDVVRIIGRQCGSTALAFAMHSHTVVANVFNYRKGKQAAEPVLRKLAGSNLVIATTGANDWLGSGGEAERVAGGFRVRGHKRFVSGSSGADLFATSVMHAGPDGDEVLHFALPAATPGLRVVNTWNAHGMRGTGSNDVVLDEVFVPDSAVVARRPAGAWHPMWNVVIPSALPLITAAYVGIAESSARLAISAARHREAGLAGPIGEMTNALVSAQILLQDMVRINDNLAFAATLETADAILIRKTLATEAIRKTVELSAEIVGGPGYFRGHTMERLLRDVRAMHFHPLPARRQQEFSGRLALGLEPVV